MDAILAAAAAPPGDEALVLFFLLWLGIVALSFLLRLLERGPIWPAAIGLVLLLVGGATAWVTARGLVRRTTPAPATLEAAERATRATLEVELAAAIEAGGEAAAGLRATGWGDIATAYEETSLLLGEMEPIARGSQLGLLAQPEFQPLATSGAPGTERVLYAHADGVVLLVAVDAAPTESTPPVVREVDGGWAVAWTRTAGDGSYAVAGFLRTELAAERLRESYEAAGGWAAPQAVGAEHPAPLSLELDFVPPRGER